MEKLLGFLQELMMTAGMKIIAAILVLVIGFKLVNVFVKALKKSKSFSKIDKTAQDFLLSVLSVTLKVVIALTSAAILGVPMTNMVAVLGSCGLAVGLALQGSLSNFAGGIMLLIFKPFKVGDFVEASGISGTVQDISILYTNVLTPDNKRAMIPNGALSNAVIVNYSSEETRRQDIEIGVSYSSDLEEVRATLLKMAAECDVILTDPAPVVNVGSYGDSAINVTLRFWTNNADYWTGHNYIKNAIKDNFDAKGISIPFPQMDVHIGSNN